MKYNTARSCFLLGKRHLLLADSNQVFAAPPSLHWRWRVVPSYVFLHNIHFCGGWHWPLGQLFAIFWPNFYFHGRRRQLFGGGFQLPQGKQSLQLDLSILKRTRCSRLVGAISRIITWPWDKHFRKCSMCPFSKKNRYMDINKGCTPEN